MREGPEEIASGSEAAVKAAERMFLWAFPGEEIRVLSDRAELWFLLPAVKLRVAFPKLDLLALKFAFDASDEVEQAIKPSAEEVMDWVRKLK